MMRQTFHFLLLLVALLCSYLCTGCHRNTYKIEGYTPEDLISEGNTVYLVSPGIGVLDSTTVRQGSFRFVGKMPETEPVYAAIRMPRYRLPVILEPGYKIQAYMQEKAAQGSPLNDALYNFCAAIDSVENVYLDSLRHKNALAVHHHKNSPDISELDALYAEMQQRKIQVAKAKLQEHPEDVVGVHILATMLREMSRGNDEKMKHLKDELEAVAHNNQKIQRLAILYNKFLRGNLGMQYEDLPTRLADGSRALLSDFIPVGSYTVLFIQQDNCSGCASLLQEAYTISSSFTKPSVNFISLVAIRNSLSYTPLKKELPYTELYTDEKDLLDAYPIKLFPETILIDPIGYVVAVGLRGKHLEDTLKTLK